MLKTKAMFPITINDQKFEVPFFLHKITVGKYIDYRAKYGNALVKQLVEIEKRDYAGNEEQKQIDLEKHIDNECLSWYTYWTGFELFEVRDEPFMQELYKIYRVYREGLNNSDVIVQDVEEVEFSFNNELWVIRDFMKGPVDMMTLNEKKTTREVVLNIYNLLKGRWSCLPYLCTVFFRRKDEDYTPVLSTGERLELIMSMQMNVAMSMLLYIKEKYEKGMYPTETKTKFSTN